METHCTILQYALQICVPANGFHTFIRVGKYALVVWKSNFTCTFVYIDHFFLLAKIIQYSWFLHEVQIPIFTQFSFKFHSIYSKDVDTCIKIYSDAEIIVLLLLLISSYSAQSVFFFLRIFYFSFQVMFKTKIVFSLEEWISGSGSE